VFETVGVECEECGGDDPGEFCLTLRVEELVSEYQPGLTLEPISCADILAGFEASGTCSDEASGYDADGDGEYEGCPAF